MVDIFDDLCLHFYLTDSSSVPDVLNTTPDKNKLLNLLASIDSQWHEFGLALHVPHNDLVNIKASPDSNIVKLSMVIHIWLTNQLIPVTWDTVITAIEGDLIKDKQKANEIRRHLGLGTH